MRTLAALAALGAAVLAVYWPEANAQGERLLRGLDHEQLHVRRIGFAQQALFEEGRGLPAWYPRELLGTPFWANPQSFPFLPTRLALLPWLDPLRLFTAAVWLSALLSAGFAFAWCRRVGLGRVAAAAAGWTFAAAGFFAARVLVGHLPLLEAYPALPLLLWRIEAALQEGGSRGRRAASLAALGLACACAALAGHPQLPAYALSAGALYAVARSRGAPRAGLRALAAMALGVGSAAFAWVPTLLLVGRSTRVLPLDRAGNDLALPFARLGALFWPWKDGWPAGVARSPAVEFHGYPTSAYFWDSVGYVGWLPWLALLLLVAVPSARRAAWRGTWRFWGVVGAAALVLALPPFQTALSLLPGTFLRSPARQLYLVGFALAALLGLAVDLALRAAREVRWPRAARLALGAALALHALDLGAHDRAFVVSAPRPRETPADELAWIARLLGDARVAIDYGFYGVFERPWDDVGFFDSILLARPYRALLDLDQAPPRRNVQQLDGGVLALRALRATGVRLVVTRHARNDLAPVPELGPHAHRVPGHAARAELFPASRLRWAEPGEIHRLLRDPAFDPLATLLLPASAPAPAPGGGPAGGEPAVAYARPSSDRIAVRIAGARPGYLRVLEAFDPGWRAALDGRPVPIVAAHDHLLAVAVPAGDHEVVFDYATPGAAAGRAVSLASGVGLLALVAATRGRAIARSRPPSA